MLLRMYQRWAEAAGHVRRAGLEPRARAHGATHACCSHVRPPCRAQRARVTEETAGEEAGIKSATLTIEVRVRVSS